MNRDFKHVVMYKFDVFVGIGDKMCNIELLKNNFF